MKKKPTSKISIKKNKTSKLSKKSKLFIAIGAIVLIGILGIYTIAIPQVIAANYYKHVVLANSTEATKNISNALVVTGGSLDVGKDAKKIQVDSYHQVFVDYSNLLQKIIDDDKKYYYNIPLAFPVGAYGAMKNDHQLIATKYPAGKQLLIQVDNTVHFVAVVAATREQMLVALGVLNNGATSGSIEAYLAGVNSFITTLDQQIAILNATKVDSAFEPQKAVYLADMTKTSNDYKQIQAAVQAQDQSAYEQATASSNAQLAGLQNNTNRMLENILDNLKTQFTTATGLVMGL